MNDKTKVKKLFFVEQKFIIHIPLYLIMLLKFDETCSL